MAASMPLPSASTSKLPLYFRSLLTVAILLWPVGVLGQSSASDNVVVRWNAAALQGVPDSRIGPPMVARALAIVHTCIFDAWTAYDKRAVFFFQAEDGIRDLTVTGVQTCALPI